MRLLLDTHTFLWWNAADPQLSATAQDLIAAPANEVFVSAATAWEIAIKHGLGKLTIPDPPSLYVPDRIHRNGFDSLPISVEHALHVNTLPHHHSDPFDRVLVAQAVVEGMTLLTKDPLITPYPVTVAW